MTKNASADLESRLMRFLMRLLENVYVESKIFVIYTRLFSVYNICADFLRKSQTFSEAYDKNA